ncbi:hypothetical protein [Clostridium ganghwense]|uniref:Chorion class high-cysteine HCB protein 13 n=1 Tax=Clostridium ganghwense TaxID=312089 RepID=A0ABT4CNL4_9CLOT|nr:hypothetical protein [Clostridium ganghwense]MCY6369661.1 hypothetical protein [Clostridium ganghwense]
MSKKCKCKYEYDCGCGYGGYGRCGGYGGCGICGGYGHGGGFDPCKLALFLLVLKRACIIDNETGTLLVFLFLLCCGGFKKQGICC